MGNKQCAKLAERLWASVNQPKTDYSRKNFINSAFTSTQRNAIKTTNVVNNNNIYSGTMGGKNTSDKVFLLSESEVYKTDAAAGYGFVKIMKMKVHILKVQMMKREGAVQYLCVCDGYMERS